MNPPDINDTASGSYFANQHCAPHAVKLEEHNLCELVSNAIPEYRIVGNKIERTYPFDNYYATIQFVNSIVSMIHREDHHPEMIVTYNRCLVRWDTHSVEGLSLNDIICAAKCDAIFTAQGPSRHDS
jgi:4a-hydroxytetrahydrobiopterin dehydratase